MTPRGKADRLAMEAALTKEWSTDVSAPTSTRGPLGRVSSGLGNLADHFGVSPGTMEGDLRRVQTELAALRADLGLELTDGIVSTDDSDDSDYDSDDFSSETSEDSEQMDSEDWRPLSPGDVGPSLVDDAAIPPPRAYHDPDEAEIDRMLQEAYDQIDVDDEGMLVRTESGRLIEEAHELMAQSSKALAAHAEVQLEQELEMARADMDAWASVGDYSPRRDSPRLTKEERAAEFLAEGDAFVEANSSPRVNTSLSAEERAAYLDFEQANKDFQSDAQAFLEEQARLQAERDDMDDGIGDPGFGAAAPVAAAAAPAAAAAAAAATSAAAPSATSRRLRGLVPLGRPPAGESGGRVSGGVEAAALHAVQQEIAELRAELGI